MRGRKGVFALCAVAQLLLPRAAAGQERAASFEIAPPGAWHPLRVAKWTTLGAALAAATYGFATSRDADDRHRRLDRLCAADPRRCAERMPDGSYADAEARGIDQDVQALDNRARLALVAGQVGVAASVVLFIFDLRRRDVPPNVPYVPARVRIGVGRDSGVELRVRLAAPDS